MVDVHLQVENIIDICLDKWNNTNNSVSSLIPSFSNKYRRQKAKSMKVSINEVLSSIEAMPEGEANRLAWQEELKSQLVVQAKDMLDMGNPKLEDIVLGSFMDVADSFVSGVQEFDPLIKMIDIMQAMRNVWIMNLIQVMAGRDVEYTQSIFAYSMLYPYTDNFLDDKSVSSDAKVVFNDRLGRRLSGESIDPMDGNEEKIYSLLGLIEDQYDRSLYPHVFESIICIHEGQCKSLSQQSADPARSESDITAISCEKGGTSVLADAYLVCEDLSENLAQMMFTFGFLLQLIDDLQDVDEDTAGGSITIFTLEVKSHKLDYMARKLIAFAYTAMDFEELGSPYNDDIRELILSNCLLMILEAISKNRKYFSKKFIKDIERYSAISFSQFKKMKKTIAKRTRNIDIDSFDRTVK